MKDGINRDRQDKQDEKDVTAAQCVSVFILTIVVYPRLNSFVALSQFGFIQEHLMPWRAWRLGGFLRRS